MPDLETRKLKLRRALPCFAVAISAELIAVPAIARSSASDPTFTKIPTTDRLTLVGVYSESAPVMKLMLSGLAVAAAIALTIWLIQFVRLHQRKVDGAGSAIAYLSGQAAAAPLFGLLGMSYGLVSICVGITNKRPGPDLIALAPGLAEAFLSLTLGILAAGIATVACHHLKARLQAFAEA
jgi:hypothetical protein